MRIVHVSSWLSRNGGGIPPVIWSLARESFSLGAEVAVAGLDDPCLAIDKSSGIPYSAARAVGPRSFGFSPELRKQIAAKLSSDSVLHVHGLWMYPGLAARRLARGRGVRVVISLHGMLEPWALNNSRWKKKVAGWMFENRNLHTADCLHALCAAEGESFRRYGLRNPIAVIPNGIDPAAFERLPGRAVLETRFPVLRNRRWVLYLSRIHPKKGLPHLLRAWAAIQKSEVRSQRSEWVLVIAGPDELGHEAQMKYLAAELGLERSVLFTGPLQGDEKLAALGNAELFVLPSFSEGFSMAVLEAAAAGLPVLLTPQCNFPELAKAGAAIEVSPDAAGCGAGLRRLLALSEAERQAMGQRGKSLVTSAYTWRGIAAQMLAVYRWLLQGGSPPACIRLD